MGVTLVDEKGDGLTFKTCWNSLETQVSEVMHYWFLGGVITLTVEKSLYSENYNFVLTK